MAGFAFGLIHAPLTPFSQHGVDYDRYAALLDFHLRHGAEGVALPMHAGESVNLTAEERQTLAEFAIRHVGARAPVVINVSEAGTAIAAALAAHAHEAGAAALVATVPYYWTPPQAMLVEHFAAIGEAGALPLFVLNAPDEMGGVQIASASVANLLGRLKNFAGLIDASLDWQYMIEAMTVARALRPDFQLISGSEYMISAGAVGATGLLSTIASIAPRLVGALYGTCRREKYGDAYALQEDAAIVYRALRDAGVPGLKAAARSFGRDCGEPRPPLSGLDAAAARALIERIDAVSSIKAEPRGWP